MTRKRVYVAILNQGTTIAGMETDVFSYMQAKAKDYQFHITLHSHKPIPNTRHHIVRDFLKGDWEYLVMLDDDNPPHSNIFDLLDLDLDVVGGVYPGKGPSGIRFHVYEADESTKPAVMRQLPLEKREGLQKVDAVGTGLICIKRHVLEKIERPFEDVFLEDGTLLYSDDIGFCLKCKEKGIDIYAHFDYHGSHYKFVDLWWVANLVAYAAETGKTNFPKRES